MSEPLHAMKFLDLGTTVILRSWALDVLAEKPTGGTDLHTDNFVLIRRMVDLTFKDKETEVFDFTDYLPPVQLVVSYDCDDLYLANQIGGKLVLAYWSDSRWKTLDLEENHFRLAPPDQGSVGVVDIYKFEMDTTGGSDPKVGWGARVENI
jgi:hypothetical protein